MYDLLIKNGTLIDGTGAVGYHCDIAVENGKIARIARNITGESKKTIDAKGLTVTPGFIDSHSHSDNAIFEYPDMVEKIEQGITTSIAGQCGNSMAPIYTKENNNKEIEGVGNLENILLTFKSFADAAKTIPLGSNNMSFIGHGSLRRAVMGYENKKPTADEMEQMKAFLRDAMENGAIGLSFGLMYTPGCYADTEELIELAMIVKEYDGILSAHIRDEGFELVRAVKEFLTVIKAAGVKGIFSHHKSAYSENWGKVTHTIRMMEEAVNEGYDIYCDVYPYTALHTGLVSLLIPKELRDKNGEGIAELVMDPDMRKKIKEEYVKKHGNSLHHLLITICRGLPEYVGKRIDEIAKMRGQDDFDAAFDIIHDTLTGVNVCDFSLCDEDVSAVIKYERSMICTDSTVVKNNSGYHPRVRGTFPRAIGRYVREKGVVSLPEMIRKCTSMPAFVYGLTSKGLLAEGFDADICIFDADKIIDKADYINRHERCEGLNYVILGGEIVVENAVYNGKRMGKFIPRQR